MNPRGLYWLLLQLAAIGAGISAGLWVYRAVGA